MTKTARKTGKREKLRTYRYCYTSKRATLIKVVNHHKRGTMTAVLWIGIVWMPIRFLSDIKPDPDPTPKYTLVNQKKFHSCLRQCYSIWFYLTRIITFFLNILNSILIRNRIGTLWMRIRQNDTDLDTPLDNRIISTGSYPKTSEPKLTYF
jgi:hypothetical protein